MWPHPQRVPLVTMVQAAMQSSSGWPMTSQGHEPKGFDQGRSRVAIT
jgi:hypothetical protein